MNHPASFRDPSGFIFRENGKLFRQVNTVYKEHYDKLMESGLYKTLVEKKLLVSHVELAVPAESGAYRILEPQKVPFISYPYEWSFSQLKDAALCTLEIHETAMAHGMILKDATAYNIQFIQGHPVFIDTLSFEKHIEGKPWVAYRQFCEHFLAPLALMAKRDIRFQQYSRIHIDGIPLDFAARNLPLSARFNPGLLMHLFLHAKSKKRFESKKVNLSKLKISRMAHLGLIDSLKKTIQSLVWKPGTTEWGDYYNDTNYSAEAFAAKQEIVEKMVQKIGPRIVWDLGANDGTFSRIAAKTAELVVSFDIDPLAVEKNYQKVKKNNEKNILPLLLDLTNPSPGLGWGNRERDSLLDRGPADCVVALALVHHLAIGNNVPFGSIAEFMAKAGRNLVIEWVPKDDSQVDRLLVSREDVFPWYSQKEFVQSFESLFSPPVAQNISGSGRTLYSWEIKG